MSDHFKTIRLRLKDKHTPFLRAQAREVNMVWNFVAELSYKHLKRTGKFMSAVDTNRYTKGAAAEGLSIHQATVQTVAREYVTRRQQFKKARLRWRKSGGTNRSLGWIPFQHKSIRYRNGQLIYQDTHISLWDHLGLSGYEFTTGSFSEDSRGRWYVNLRVKIQSTTNTATGMVGVDLGLKATATTSNGDVLVGRRYRELESQLGIAQRARKKNRARAINAKIKNRRLNDNHQFSRKLVDTNAAIFVGDVSSSKLLKTNLAKSVQDAGWYQLKVMLEYKSRWAGVIYEEVNEAYSTQTCSCCGVISANSPKGRAGLGIREWTCSSCGTIHDRDVNAAKNILAVGYHRLAEGSALSAGITNPGD